MALFNAEIIDFNKSLSVNKIRDKSPVLLFIEDSLNIDPITYKTIINKQELINNNGQNLSLSLNKEDRELLLNIYKQIQKIKDDYEGILKKLNININLNDKDIDNKNNNTNNITNNNSNNNNDNINNNTNNNLNNNNDNNIKNISYNNNDNNTNNNINIILINIQKIIMIIMIIMKWII